MSPEQTRGRALDKRTDIWAFGCVLYEMLTGRAALAGDTVSDTIAAILGREPDWAALPASTPAGVRRLLKRCLEKDTKRRLRDIGDAQVDLESAIGDAAAPRDASGRTSTVPVRRLRLAVAVLGALLMVSLVAATAPLWKKNGAASSGAGAPVLHGAWRRASRHLARRPAYRLPIARQAVDPRRRQ
jgi:serine/threonine protein kinase